MSSAGNGSSSSATKCLKLGLFLLPPVLLALFAASLAHPKEDSGSNGNMGNGEENGPAAVFFGHLICYMFQLIATTYCFTTALGAGLQYNILQQYMREGSALDCTGKVTKHHITSHRTNFIETRQTHILSYSYQYLDEDQGTVAIYIKDKTVVYHCTLCNPPRLTTLTGHGQDSQQQSLPSIPLKILPGQPGSGYPTLLLEEELNGYWVRKVLLVAVAGAASVVLPWMLLTIGAGDAWPAVAASCAWSVVAGFYLARTKLQSWEESTLRSGLVHEYEAPSPMAVAHVITEDQEESPTTKETEMSSISIV